MADRRKKYLRDNKANIPLSTLKDTGRKIQQKLHQHVPAYTSHEQVVLNFYYRHHISFKVIEY